MVGITRSKVIFTNKLRRPTMVSGKFCFLFNQIHPSHSMHPKDSWCCCKDCGQFCLGFHESHNKCMEYSFQLQRPDFQEVNPRSDSSDSQKWKVEMCSASVTSLPATCKMRDRPTAAWLWDEEFVWMENLQTTETATTTTTTATALLSSSSPPPLSSSTTVAPAPAPAAVLVLGTSY